MTEAKKGKSVILHFVIVVIPLFALSQTCPFIAIRNNHIRNIYTILCGVSSRASLPRTYRAPFLIMCEAHRFYPFLCIGFCCFSFICLFYAIHFAGTFCADKHGVPHFWHTFTPSPCASFIRFHCRQFIIAANASNPLYHRYQYCRQFHTQNANQNTTHNTRKLNDAENLSIKLKMVVISF